MKIFITGASGFIGKPVINYINKINKYNLIKLA